MTDIVTYALSVAAMIITGVVRDTAAIYAKLDEIVIALRETRNKQSCGKPSRATMERGVA